MGCRNSTPPQTRDRTSTDMEVMEPERRKRSRKTSREKSSRAREKKDDLSKYQPSEQRKTELTNKKKTKPKPEETTRIITKDYIEMTHKHVTIQSVDPQAFNDSLLQRRQNAIENQSYRSTIDSWRPQSLQQLADLCKSFVKNKELIDQHWIIFYWIASNIEYDTVSYFTKNYADQTAEGVFRNKKGVCAGYANIYKYLCDALNLPCETISGYSKGYGFDNGKGAPTETDHAWNAVQIDNHWYLIESTWAAGHLNKEKKFERDLNNYYFLPRPEEMIYHHLPEEEQWQLLAQPIKMDQYLEIPKLRPLYFEMKLELVSPRNRGHVDFVEGKPYALVLVRSPADINLLADLELDDKKIEGGHRVQFDHKRKVHCCYFAPNTTGTHTINIYAKHGDSVGEYSQAIDLRFDVREMPTDPISFPKTWDIFFDFKLKIKSPKDTHLIKLHDGRREAQVRIQTPDDVELIGNLTNNDEEKVEGAYQVFYDHTKDLWVCKFAPNQDGIFDANILAKKKSDEGSYSSAVSFKIDAKNIPKPPLSYPTTWPLYYDLRLNIKSPKNTHLIKVHNGRSEGEIRIEAPDDVELIGNLKSSDGDKIDGADQVFYDRTQSLWICKFAPNRDGIFDANIFAKRKSDEGSYSSVVSFKIDAKNIPKPPRSYPKTWQLFHDLGLAIISPHNRGNAVWAENASFTEIRVSAPDDVQISCGISFQGKKNEDCSLAQFDHEKGHWQLLFAPQREGLHQLTIYAKRLCDDGGSSNSVAQFTLDVTKIRKSMRFPVQYGKFLEKKCFIYEPLNGVLKRGAKIPIHCFIPGAKAANIQVDGKWLDKTGYSDSVLKREISVGSKDVLIYASYGEIDHYDGLLAYSVE